MIPDARYRQTTPLAHNQATLVVGMVGVREAMVATATVVEAMVTMVTATTMVTIQATVFDHVVQMVVSDATALVGIEE